MTSPPHPSSVFQNPESILKLSEKAVTSSPLRLQDDWFKLVSSCLLFFFSCPTQEQMRWEGKVDTHCETGPLMIPFKYTECMSITHGRQRFTGSRPRGTQRSTQKCTLTFVHITYTSPALLTRGHLSVSHLLRHTHRGHTEFEVYSFFFLTITCDINS